MAAAKATQLGVLVFRLDAFSHHFELEFLAEGKHGAREGRFL